MSTFSLTVLGHDGCDATGSVCAALTAAGFAFEYSVLEAHATYSAACSFTVPTVLVTGGYGGPERLIQPEPETLVADLAKRGVTRTTLLATGL